MSAKAVAKPVTSTPEELGERTYLFLCLTALLMVLAILLTRGERERALFPVLLALAGLVLRWRITPGLLLIALGAVLVLNEYGRPAWLRRVEHRTLLLTLGDLVLCISTLAFLAGFYRLQSLTVAIFPHDPRRRSAAGGPALDRKRSERLATPAELAMLLGMLPFWAGLAYFLYPELVSGVWTNPELPGAFNEDGNEFQQRAGLAASGLVDVSLRSRRIILGLGGFVLVAATSISYLAWRKMTPIEAELALQDVVWEETRSEQRRISRWAAWGRRKMTR